MTEQLSLVSCYGQLGFPGDARGKECARSAGDTGDAGLIPGSERSAGKGIGYPLQSTHSSILGLPLWLSW